MKVELKRFDEALSFLDKAVKIESRSEKVHTLLGRIWYEKGSIEKVVKECEIALKCNPNSAQAYLWLGLAYAKLDKIDDAIISWNKVKQISKNETEIHQAEMHIQVAKGWLEMLSK